MVLNSFSRETLKYVFSQESYVSEHDLLWTVFFYCIEQRVTSFMSGLTWLVSRLRNKSLDPLFGAMRKTTTVSECRLSKRNGITFFLNVHILHLTQMETYKTENFAEHVNPIPLHPLKVTLCLLFFFLFYEYNCMPWWYHKKWNIIFT
jgi:hypothetical protein